MAPSEALRLCPGAALVQGNFHHYASVHMLLKSKLESLGFAVESSSIDEFYVDFPGSYPDARRLLEEFSGWVRREIGITVSIGVAPTKLLAKLASEIVKPCGLTLLPPDCLPGAIEHLGVERLLGIGKVSSRLLKSRGVSTLGHLMRAPEGLLCELGLTRGGICSLLSGDDDGEGVTLVAPPAKSISSRMTLPHDVDDPELLRNCLHFLSDHVSSRMRKEGLCAKTITVTIRYEDFSTTQKSRTLKENVVTCYEVVEHAIPLLDENLQRRKPVRLIGLGLSSLERYEGSMRQMPILNDELKRFLITDAVDRIRRRHGNKVITLASSACIFGGPPRQSM